MQYGINYPMNPEMEERLLPAPFYLHFDDKENNWDLCKPFCEENFKKIITIPIRIAKFISIEELFLHLLQSNEWYCTLSSSEKNAIADCIKFVFLTEDNVSRYDFKLRYHCHMQFQCRKPIVAAEFILNSSDFTEAARSMGRPDPEDEFDALRLAQKFKYSSEGNRVKVFDNCDDLAWWALNEIIGNNKQIALCKACRKYFITSRENKKYCSTNCANMSKIKGIFLDEPELKRLSNRIEQKFIRKKHSYSLYSYNKKTHDKDYNEHALFSDLEEKANREEPTEALFNSEHFNQMWETYNRLRKTRFDAAEKAREAKFSGKISEREYKKVLGSVLSWLENVAEQLSAFTHDGENK